MSKPSFSNSPWILGAPQVGFSFVMRSMAVRISRLILGLPRRGRERNRQYNRNPVRCQPTTVSGLTMSSVLLHRCQIADRTTQNSRLRGVKCGRGCFTLPDSEGSLGHPAGTGYTFWGHSIAVVESGLVYPFFKAVFYAEFPSFALATLAVQLFSPHQLINGLFAGVSGGRGAAAGSDGAFSAPVASGRVGRAETLPPAILEKSVPRSEAAALRSPPVKGDGRIFTVEGAGRTRQPEYLSCSVLAPGGRWGCDGRCLLTRRSAPTSPALPL